MRKHHLYALFILLIFTGCTEAVKKQTSETSSIKYCDSISHDGKYHIGCECDEIKSHKLHSSNKHIYYMTEVDSLPKFPQGEYAKGCFIKHNRKASLITYNHNTAVEIEFIVEKDGSITSTQVSHSIDKIHDGDALAIISKMPKWKPATIGGHVVRCKMKLIIPYRVHSLGT